MPTKKKWLSENWQSLAWTLGMIVFTMGVLYTKLEAKIDRYQAEEIVAKKIKDHAYPLTDGVRLESEYGFIKEQLKAMQEELKDINKGISKITINTEVKQRSRTTANKNINIPNMAIKAWPEPGVRHTTPIKELMQ